MGSTSWTVSEWGWKRENFKVEENWVRKEKRATLFTIFNANKFSTLFTFVRSFAGEGVEVHIRVQNMCFG